MKMLDIESSDKAYFDFMGANGHFDHFSEHPRGLWFTCRESCFGGRRRSLFSGNIINSDGFMHTPCSLAFSIFKNKGEVFGIQFSQDRICMFSSMEADKGRREWEEKKQKSLLAHELPVDMWESEDPLLTEHRAPSRFPSPMGMRRGHVAAL